ncbi:MAG: hypothetical protein WCH99_04810 [Verrucomicrobiota bacterium]
MKFIPLFLLAAFCALVSPVHAQFSTNRPGHINFTNSAGTNLPGTIGSGGAFSTNNSHGAITQTNQSGWTNPPSIGTVFTTIASLTGAGSITVSNVGNGTWRIYAPTNSGGGGLADAPLENTVAAYGRKNGAWVMLNPETVSYLSPDVTFGFYRSEEASGLSWTVNSPGNFPSTQFNVYDDNNDSHIFSCTLNWADGGSGAINSSGYYYAYPINSNTGLEAGNKIEMGYYDGPW